MVAPIDNPGLGRPSSLPPQGGRASETFAPGRTGLAPGLLKKGPETLSGSEGSQIRSVNDAIDALRARLNAQLEQRFGSRPAEVPTASENIPTAEQVANRVLGFVQQRLEKEAQGGADAERLQGLLNDARQGVEQGFSEAREQIEAIGLMNDELSGRIDESFDRISTGLDELTDRFLGVAGVADPEDRSAEPGSAVVSAGYAVERAAIDSFSFEVMTSEGDRVTVKMAETRYAARTGSAEISDQGGSASVSSLSFFSGQYSLDVQGDLNEAERSALADLFKDVEKVSRRFFNGNIQAAFSKAQQLDLSGEALASFSLNLTSTRITSVSAYEAVSQQPAINSELRPLGNLASEIGGVAESAAEQGIDPPQFQGLMSYIMESIAPQQEEIAAEDPFRIRLMEDFLSAIIEAQLLSDDGA